MHKIKLTNVADAQKFVTVLSAHDGDFTLFQLGDNPRSVDAKSIMGVVTLITQDTLGIRVPSTFDILSLENFLTK